MIRLLVAILLLAVVPAMRAAGFRGDPPAVWSGTVELPGGTTLDFSVELAKDSGTISIPMQDAKDRPLSDVVVTEKALKFAIKEVGAAWEMTVAEDGKSATGVLKQGGEFKTTMKRLAAGESATKQLKRPQEPKPPFPYDASDIVFENAVAGAQLAGTLTVPKGAGPFPCAVLVSGSGPQDRDETLLGHRPFLVIADHLTRHGIAVLRYDDRGVAKSSGNFDAATSDDFAEDAIAAVEFLKSRKEIDAKHIGIVGHSEGGLIAPMCASASNDVAFIVLLAGTGLRGAELMPIQTRAILVSNGVTPAEAQLQAMEDAEVYRLMLAGKSEAEIRDRFHAAVSRQVRTAAENGDLSEEERTKKIDALVAEQVKIATNPWFRRFIALDPLENLRKVACPVLAVNGELDLQVPPKENLPRIEKALKEAGNKDVTVIEFPGLNHLFQKCTTGSPSEYANIEETCSPVVLESVTGWIRKRTGLD